MNSKTTTVSLLAVVTLASLVTAAANAQTQTIRRITEQEPNSPVAQIAGNIAMGERLTIEGNVQKRILKGRRRGTIPDSFIHSQLDRYQIVIPQTNRPETVQFSVSSSDSKTVLTVHRDQNNNREIDSGEPKLLETAGANRFAAIQLQPGTYIVQIRRATEKEDSAPVPYTAQVIGTRPAPRPASQR